MKHIWLTLGLLTSCCAFSDNLVSIGGWKLKAGDKVQVLEGFYINCKGYIFGQQGYWSKDPKDSPKYEVQLETCQDREFKGKVIVRESALKVLNESQN